MNFRVALVVSALLFGHAVLTVAQDAAPATARSITLEEAVDLALQHNHIVRIAAFKVEEARHAKEAARSSYFPSLKNESAVLHVSDVQHVEIPAGGLGNVTGSLVPPIPITLLQGGQTLETSGTSLSQPLLQLLKVKEKNAIRSAELNATRAESDQTRNQVALTVHQLYYKILEAEARRDSAEARIGASQDLEKERGDQLKYGSSLEQDVIETRAQGLQAKQELLVTDLQLSDLKMALNDTIGLPLSTELALSRPNPKKDEVCRLEECKQLAMQSHPEVRVAEQQVEKANAAIRLAKHEYLPDAEVFARYSYQNNVPFLDHNFGTVGFLLSYEIFDGGRRRAVLGEHNSQLEQAKENLSRVKDEVELRVQSAYNKIERSRQMVGVSEQLLALRSESHRVAAAQLEKGAALQSQIALAAAQELDAKAALLQSQLEYVQAADEMMVATGRTPE
jgi:outer membrane protein TolC